MVDERKVRLMTRLARYEQREGREALRINKFYRSDYIGLALLRNFFMTTIGYGLLAVSYTHLGKPGRRLSKQSMRPLCGSHPARNVKEKG